ncbi:MinD/ParA family ATP-binding protein [Microbacterium sp. PMB16]|uniref:MinD/ParA family ATP-binding protein n=1 Tax=Microbacterium sp. PMB16 TaxID=3120157 RepID=UPI003F4B5D53
MTPKNTADHEENPLGVLDDAASLDTAGIGILGGTAQVSVTLPKDEDDDLDDDGVVDGEVIGDLIIDEAPPALAPKAVPAATVAAVTATKSKAESAAGITTEPAAEASTAPTVSKPSKQTASKPSIFMDPIVIDEPPVPATTTDDVVDAEVVEESEPTGTAVTAEAAEPAEPVAAAEPPASGRRATDEEAAAARFLARADADVAPSAKAPASAAPTPIQKETTAVSRPEPRAVTPQPARAAARTDVTLTSKRLEELAEPSRESADLLTADRLLDPSRIAKPEPEGAWSHFLYTVSGRRINIGDGRRARERKALSARIAAPLTGGARFVPVLSRKGGVGKTTITALLGMALADAREDRVIAVDANPDRGTLAERVVRPHHNKSVRDLVRIHDEVKGYHDISAIVARDATRLDVLASDSDPRIAEAFSDSDYRDVAGVAAHYYSLVLTDTGTGIVHSVMSATLDLADQIVIVSGLSVDEARLASETLTWLETNGYAEQAREAIVVLNQSTPGTPLVRLNELQAHFATRAKSVIRMPYDPQIAGGGTIVFANLQPETRIAARELAALLVEGLRARAA